MCQQQFKMHNQDTGLTIFSPSGLPAPTQKAIRVAIEKKFNLQIKLKISHINQIIQKYGNCLKVEFDHDSKYTDWKVVEVFWSGKEKTKATTA